MKISKIYNEVVPIEPPKKTRYNKKEKRHTLIGCTDIGKNRIMLDFYRKEGLIARAIYREKSFEMLCTEEAMRFTNWGYYMDNFDEKKEFLLSVGKQTATASGIGNNVICHTDYWYNRIPTSAFIDENSKIVFENFFGKIGEKDNALNKIISYEKKIRKERNNRAYISRERKKKEEMRTDFKGIPKLPKTNNYIKRIRPDYMVMYEKRRFCSHCENELDFFKTKHNETITCPSCKKRVQVKNFKILKGGIYEFYYLLVPQFKKNGDLILRYVKYDHKISLTKNNDKIVTSFEEKEVAREIVNPKTPDIIKNYEYSWNNQWYKQSRWYFKEYNWFNYNKYYCENCYIHKPTLVKVLSCMDSAKYLNVKEFVNSLKNHKRYYLNILYDFLLNRKACHLYEVFHKINMPNMVFNLIDNGYSNGYSSCIDTDATEPLKILKLSKNAFRTFKDYYEGDKNVLCYLQDNPNASIQEIEDAKYLGFRSFNIQGLTLRQYVKWSKKQNPKNPVEFFEEYKHYVYVLQELEYPLDKGYLLPKDFRKEDTRVAKEYELHMAEIEKKKKAAERRLARKNEKLFAKQQKQITEALMNFKGLKKFMEGSRGLLIKVPETVQELREEGRRLHNCLATYENRVRNGETSIFFVRKLDDPSKEYFAFEYRDGCIIQLHCDRNGGDSEGKVTDFVQAFAKVLEKKKYNPSNIIAA